MEKNNSKIIAVFALVIAVVALSVGFAAFADDLTIAGSATLEKNDVFEEKVQYVSASQSCKYDDQSNAITSNDYNAGTLSEDSWSGISVPLQNVEGKKKVTCTAQIENASVYDAWLKSIATTTGLTCEAADPTNDPVSNLAAVCGTNNANVKVTVIIGASTSSTDKIEVQGAQASKTDTTGKIDAATGSGQDLVKGTTNAYVIFEYLGTAEPDGNVRITLPTVTHHYSTAPTT